MKNRRQTTFTGGPGATVFAPGVNGTRARVVGVVVNANGTNMQLSIQSGAVTQKQYIFNNAITNPYSEGDGNDFVGDSGAAITGAVSSLGTVTVTWGREAVAS